MIINNYDYDKKNHINKTIKTIDSKLSFSINHITWSLANVKESGLTRVQQKGLRRALINAQEYVSKALEIIDTHIGLMD